MFRITLASSVLAHAAIFAVTRLGAGHEAAVPGQVEAARALLDVELLQVRNESVEIAPEVAPAAPAKGPSVPPYTHTHTHTHTYPVAPDHDEVPHDPSTPHERGPAAHARDEAPRQLPTNVASDVPTARFTMTYGGGRALAGERSAGAEPTVRANGGAQVGGVASTNGEEIVPESGVSVRARVVEQAPTTYPLGQEDIDADVALDIVVDTAGGVESARVVRGAGRGFDEAAVLAVRKYRFTPAERSGRPVRVRMPWIVQFRGR